ncbi:MAG: GIY-YIG nuclease family protein [Candidatus Omnitrophota bacterium]
MFYTYVLRSRKNNKIYKGHTKDLQNRLSQHNTENSKKKFSCINGPWELMFFETFNTRSEAMRYEKFLKTGKGREHIREKIAEL